MREVIKAPELYKLITKQDVYNAFRHIQSNKLPLKASTKYDIEIHGELFPPKEFLRIMAHQKGYQIQEDGFYGGKANKPFEDLGFKVIEKKQAINYWLYAPGRDAEHWSLFFNENIIAIGWDALGDLSKYTSKNKIREVLQNTYGGKTDKKNDVAANYDFFHRLKIGDIVIVKTGQSTLLGYGEVVSDYFYDDSRDTYKSCRSVNWKRKGAWNTDYKFVLKTLTDITKYTSKTDRYNFYYEEIMDSMNTIKDEFISWYLKYSTSNYFQDHDKFSDYLENSLENFEINIFDCNLSNYDFVINHIKNTFNDNKEKYSRSKDAPDGGKLAAILGKKNYFKFLEEKFKNPIDRKKEISKEVIQHNLNQILYGPPGTGKTYVTIEKALNIITPDFVYDDSIDDREKLKKHYNKLVESGNIVFTTFHQSMAYEDFVEGIKPKTINKNVVYDVEDGLFKKIAQKATINIENSSSDVDITFEDAFSQLQDDWEEDKEMQFSMKTDNKEFKIIGFTNKSIQFEKASGGKDHTLSINTLKKGFYDNLTIKSTGIGIYYPPIIKHLKNYTKKVEDRNSLQNYVLIIDEINRGNVSAIFGELITLIEESKRLGNKEALEVTLPYSKEKFGVPNNLHIIGTMNTADRSVEALDTALRRRFVFEEMMPDISKIENPTFLLNHKIELSSVLEIMNKRIEVLIDRDHTIGHSYFMNISTEEQLANTFNNNIVPLLQEYFYGDYGKIGLVLGEGFVDCAKQHTSSTQLFADFKDVDDVEDYNTKVFRLKKMEASNIIKALNQLLNIKENSSNPEEENKGE